MNNNHTYLTLKKKSVFNLCSIANKIYIVFFPYQIPLSQK